MLAVFFDTFSLQGLKNVLVILRLDGILLFTILLPQKNLLFLHQSSQAKSSQCHDSANLSLPPCWQNLQVQLIQLSLIFIFLSCISISQKGKENEFPLQICSVWPALNCDKRTVFHECHLFGIRELGLVSDAN